MACQLAYLLENQAPKVLSNEHDGNIKLIPVNDGPGHTLINTYRRPNAFDLVEHIPCAVTDDVPRVDASPYTEFQIIP